MTVRPAEQLRVLHLFSNYKWTGPADPAIRCAYNLREAGADVMFAQALWTHRGAEHRMRKELRRSRMPVTADLELRKHFHVPSLLRDARTLRARLRRRDFDLLHCHMLADHLIATMARRGCGRAVPIVRSLYDPEPPPGSWRNRLVFRSTDAVIAPTRGCAARTAERYRLPPSRVVYQEPPVEMPGGDGASLRAELGLAPDEFTIGITARIQPHRRFSVLWDVARRVVDEEPRARFVLLGRGNERDTQDLVLEPVRRLGLEDAVVLPGYLLEPKYSAALRALDLFLFLVPGSDGTCRAVREAMAFGLPVVATKRGMLPELVGDAGAVCDESPDALAAAVLQMIRDRELRERAAKVSLSQARDRMNPRAAAAQILELYASLSTGHGGG